MYTSEWPNFRILLFLYIIIYDTEIHFLTIFCQITNIMIIKKKKTMCRALVWSLKKRDHEPCEYGKNALKILFELNTLEIIFHWYFLYSSPRGVEYILLFYDHLYTIWQFRKNKNRNILTSHKVNRTLSIIVQVPSEMIENRFHRPGDIIFHNLERVRPWRLPRFEKICPIKCCLLVCT